MNLEADHNTQARSNPVFLTAKTAVCLMAKADIPNSAEIVKALGIENNAPLQGMTDPDIILGNALVVEAKYRTMCNLIEASGYNTYVDLPCGYTPKAIHMTEGGKRFIGLDLPIVVQEMEPAIRSLAMRHDKISFHAVDATNYESIASALRDVKEPLCITTEGMMMYFDENEVDAVISNIRSILELHGGSWITPDPEFALQFFRSFHSVFGEDSFRKLLSTSETAKGQSDVVNLSNSFILDPADISGSSKAAAELLRKHGLKAEKINLAEHMPTLNIYRQLTADQIMNFKEAMGHCHYWVITLDDEQKHNHKIQQAQPFGMNYALENRILRISLCGRLDSLAAPKLLTAWEDVKAVEAIDGAEVECAGLEYITSAGVRVLLIIQESCSLGVTLTDVNQSIAKILSQKGFTNINPSI